MPKLIENGNIYIAVSPLYKIRKRVDHYIYTDEELKKVLAKLGDNMTVQRFKGLGEMNADQLWETTMNPKNRLLNKVTIDDAVKANEVFSKLMGDDVEPRKQFIVERAHQARIDA
jgi:DNA gyrase subunit B